MTKYFVARIKLFDTEDFFTKKEVKEIFEGMMDNMTIGYDGLVFEIVKVKEVELLEYEKED